jgi:hypothetical protein
MLENQTLVLKAAKRLHCSLVNIAASDLVEGKVGWFSVCNSRETCCMDYYGRW